MKFVKIVGITSFVLMTTTSLWALPVRQNNTLSAADLSAIAELEKSAFDYLEKEGIEKLFLMLVPNLSSEMVSETQKADQTCGKLFEVELAKTESRGSRFSDKWYVSIHEGCMLHWKLSYKRERAKWELINIVFNSNPVPF